MLHFVQISAIERCHTSSNKHAKDQTSFEGGVCSLMRAHTNAVATHRLWWRIPAGYLACVFGTEVWAWMYVDVAR